MNLGSIKNVINKMRLEFIYQIILCHIADSMPSQDNINKVVSQEK